MSLLILNAEIPGLGIRDVRCTDNYVDCVAHDLEPLPHEHVVNANGGALVPGLNDHHIHLYATAAARTSLDCAPSALTNAEALTVALRQFPGDKWIRGYGFHDSVCADLGRAWLDLNGPARPIRIQHQSGKLWVLNSPALKILDIRASQVLPAGVERAADGSLTGRFYDLDAWLGEKWGRQRPSLKALSAELASYGVTAVTDAGVNNNDADFVAISQACANGELHQRVQLMGDESLSKRQGIKNATVNVGPLKVYLREAQLPTFDNLVERIRASHQIGRPIAAHCVTRVELIFLLSALEAAGVLAGDRIEHASIADTDALAMIADMGVTVVTQPHFITERGDRYLHDVDESDVPFLYRGRGFLDQGIGLAGGSDGPYGSIDPWTSMRAAVSRKTRRGLTMAASECLQAKEAFALFCGTLEQPAAGYGAVVAGMLADLCLMSQPWSSVLEKLDSRDVRLTVCRGRVIYDANA